MQKLFRPTDGAINWKQKIVHLLFDAMISLQNGSKNRSHLKENIKKGSILVLLNLFLIYFVKIDQNLDSYCQKRDEKTKKSRKVQMFLIMTTS